MKWLALALLITSRTSCDAQAKTPQRFPVTSLQVAHALMRRGLTVADDQIFLPASIVSSSAEPLLDVDSIEPLRGGSDGYPSRSKVKLVCHSSQMCVPFYAVVVRPLDSRTSVLAAAVPTPKAITSTAGSLPSVHAGGSATLVVDSGQMHIELPVICLQNGAIGARIHVSSPDHKQNYTATVVSPTLLTGSL